MKFLSILLALMLALVPASFAGGLRYDDGTKTVTTAGTAVALVASSTLATAFTICGDTGNTGKIAVGPSPVAAAGSQQGVILSAGQCASFATDYGGRIDLATIKVDSTVNGEEASFFYWEETT